MEHTTTLYDRAADRGVPSLVWRFGQDRRLDMIRQWAALDGAQVLVDGCGIGAYVRKLQALADQVIGLDIEEERVREGSRITSNLHVGACEYLPYRDRTFDVVLSHEVLEHVQDDRLAAAEMVRVLKSGGRAVIFAPNRLYRSRPTVITGETATILATPRSSITCLTLCATAWRRTCVRTPRPACVACSMACRCA